MKFLSIPNKPFALPLRGWSKKGDYCWEDWRREARKQYPVRYFLSETVPGIWRRNVVRHWNTAQRWTYGFVYRYHMLDLRNKAFDYRWGWVDVTDKMIYASFNLLQQFVEKEKPFERIDWSHGAVHRRAAKEIKALYAWWTVGRRADHDAKGKLDYAALDAKDQAMLLRLVKIRMFLWT